jgi:hypothetical protein
LDRAAGYDKDTARTQAQIDQDNASSSVWELPCRPLPIFVPSPASRRASGWFAFVVFSLWLGTSLMAKIREYEGANQQGLVRALGFASLVIRLFDSVLLRSGWC